MLLSISENDNTLQLVVKIMHYPLFVVLRFGAFQYCANGKVNPIERNRLIYDYEFEFYTEDLPGGLRNDGVFYPSTKGTCTLTRPGQRQDVVRPNRGYFFNISTQDPELCDLLDHLPNSFTLWNISQIIKLIQEMIATEDPDSLEGRILLQGYSCQIIHLLAHYRQGSNALDHTAYRHRKTLRMADKYIREHLAEDLSLGALAKLCNLDPTYFHKLYTAAYGKTPAQHVLGYRIAAAKTGLIECRLSVEELATRCGFSNQSYFCRKFKQVTGMTPLQYRSQMLSQK